MLPPEVLVLGATGRIGSVVVAALLEAGSPVLAVARDPGRLQALARRHAGSPDLEVLAAPVATDTQALALVEQLSARPRRLRAVVDAIAGQRRCGRLLDRPSATLRRSLRQDLDPHLVAARQLVPYLAATAAGLRYLILGGPRAECGWAGYGHASVALAANRMLARVLHEEARELGVRLQMLAVDAPVQAADNAGHASADWPSALGVGRRVVSLLATASEVAPAIVAHDPAGPAIPSRFRSLFGVPPASTSPTSPFVTARGSTP